MKVYLQFLQNNQDLDKGRAPIPQSWHDLMIAPPRDSNPEPPPQYIKILEGDGALSN